VIEANDKIFRFASLANYTLKQRVLIRAADLAFYIAIKTLGLLTRFEVRGQENLDSILSAGKQPIYSFWHDRIFLGTYFFRNRGIVVLTSQSFDGEYITRFIQRFGYGAVRGSSSQGGPQALVEMIKTMRGGHPMAFAVDGPRGPRYETKAGPVLLAKKTGNPILPFVVEPRHYWKVSSWDKMQIPMPFSKALMAIGKPIYVDPQSDEADVSMKLTELQHSLKELTAVTKKWREDGG
jgi:lysophospholipid acyltransferase (LPLAT)-like uncharacterized protein